MKSRLTQLISVFILGLVIGISLNPKTAKELFSPSSTPTPSSQTVTVTRVVDGDTIVISSGEKVRYIGMDTPETVDPQRPVGCFGHEASEENKKLVEGKTVKLVKDVSNTDRYGRLLRYVYIETPSTPSGLFVNEYLVKEGYARILTYPPDVKYSDLFRQDEQKAQQMGKGLWSLCK